MIEVENDEAQSRLKMKLAKDKLLVYGLTEKEIENAKSEDGVQKAKMILRSRAAGVVVVRNVVPGNYYTSADLLMTIAPLDHLWVRGSVSELDADQVEVGQKLKIIFPFSDRTIDAKVDYIDKAIDSDSRSAKFRTTITNPEGKLKAGMFVRMLLEIPPKTGQHRDSPRRHGLGRSVRLRVRQEAGDDRPVRATANLRGEGKQRLRDRGRAIARPPRSHAGRRSRDDRQLDPGANVRGPGHDRRGPARRRDRTTTPSIPATAHARDRTDAALTTAR